MELLIKYGTGSNMSTMERILSVTSSNRTA